ncbi:unnamed protein product [Oikopleura dioica]|uniref:Apple domain-containing protein n=1 Tax=Oikopleura dioica TaxID=34765 RepID=E4X2G6_OIKDI|nr:unnamed protein product [Oikopleura dioica]
MKSCLFSLAVLLATIKSSKAHEKTCREQKHIVTSVGQSFGLLKPIKNSSRFTCLSLCQFVSVQILHINKNVFCQRAFNPRSSECRLKNLPELARAIRLSAKIEYDSRITVPFETYCQHLCEMHPYCYAAETASIGQRGYHCNLIHRSLLKPKPSMVCQKQRCTTFICEKTAHNILFAFHR